MTGLSLRTGVTAGGSFSPGMPVAASTPSAKGVNGKRTISQQAYGVTSGTNTGGNTAAVGSMGVGMLAMAALAFIWWSLPR